METLERLFMQFLLSKNLHPFSVLYFIIKKETFIKISFYSEEEIDELEELLDYKYFSDRSGLVEIRDSRTVLLRGMILNKFINLAEKWDSKQ